MVPERYQLIWEDDVDHQSHATVISLEEFEDPFKHAKNYLDGTTGPGPGNYLIETVRKLKPGELGNEF